MTRIALVLVFVVLGGSAACAQDGPPAPFAAPGAAAILVEVNGVPITRADLDEALALDEQWRMLAREGSGRNIDALRRNAEARVVETLVDEVLLAEAARAARVFLSPEEEREVTRQFAERVKFEWGDVRNLEDYLKAKGVPIDRLKNRHRQGFLVRKLIHEEAGRTTFVRPEEIRRYYEEHKESYRQSGRIEVSRIVVRKAGRTPEAARAMIDDALEAVRGGKSFAEVAPKYPDTPNAETGGRGPLLSFAELGKEAAAALEGRKEGEVSGVIETPKHYLIVKVEKLVSESYKPFEEVQDEIFFELENRTRMERFEQMKKRLRDKAFVKRRG